MTNAWQIFGSRMRARFFATLVLAIALPLGIATLLAARERAEERTALDEQRLELLSSSLSQSLVERASAAEAIARVATSGDVGPEGLLLRERVAQAPAFRTVTLHDWQEESAGDRRVFAPTRAERAALQAGRSVFFAAAADESGRAVYIARLTSAMREVHLALFELSPAWLWRGVDEPRQEARLSIVAPDGSLLRGASLPSMPRVPTVFSWQREGREWRASVSRVPLASDALAAAPWTVAAAAPRPHPSGLAAGHPPDLIAALAIALAAALTGAGLLGAAYVPGLRALRSVLRGADAGRIPGVLPAARAADEVGEVLQAYEAGAAAVRDRLQALDMLSEIDRLLLSFSELEQMLDAILPRVRAVTRCHSVGITLLDADAPSHGRVYVAWDSAADLPVSRVALDPEMLAVLGEAHDGLTVARCEEGRHSFLMPLKEHGAELFWIWPVQVHGRLVAILAAGYRDATPPEATAARYGAEFAARLAIALSNSARDEHLYRQAHFDPLTQLPNRQLFLDRLAQELASAASGAGRGALLYVDLDHFKKVNDTVGHAAGDQLLTIVAQRLRACVKDGDTVARLGGDEFTVVLRNVADPDAARGIAERIIESLQLPVNLAGRDHYVRASVGITLFPDDGTAIDELMRNADIAMYRAKASGRGRAVFFDRQMARAAAPAFATHSGLFRALRRREFSLYYQPQYELGGGRLAGLEALLRWQTPRDGLRHPNEIVPAAEESGLIADIGAWVLDTACGQLAAWQAQGIAPPRLALNVSVQQLRQQEFPRTVRRALERNGLAPQLLELELTECVFVDPAASEAVMRLAEIGVRLALDDFGTGNASLSHVRRYPVHVLKIDRSFIEELPHDPAAVSLAETIILMAHSLDRRVAAEGVETLEQLDFLRARNCDFAQGFYLARPLATAAVTELLHAHSGAGGSGTREDALRATG